MSAATSDALHTRVQQFISESLRGTTREDFDVLACDIARFQAKHVEAVGRLMAARGIDPAKLTDPAAIPAMPTDAFRLRRIAAHPEAQDERCFITSGTTGGRERRGRHPMRSTRTYTHAALAWGRRMLLTDDVAFIGLVADENAAPSSSLTFMLARFAEQLPQQSWHVTNDMLDVEELARVVRRLTTPALVAGTSFAFVYLCDRVSRLPLPAGSRVMQTGGFKGRSRQVDADTLRQSIASCFDIDTSAVIGEYGMTELSSQLYQHGDAGYHAPPWLRVHAVDPETLATLPTGQRGLARFVDLANVDSSVAVQTADLIVVDDDGTIELLGRAPGATPRGCSLAIEHLVSP